MSVVSAQVFEAFKSWDVQGKGMISRAQLLRIIRRLTPQVGEADIEALLAATGAERGGGVYYHDFINWLWSDGVPTEEELRKEAARERGLWEDALKDASVRAAKTWPADRVDKYFSEVQRRLAGEDYIKHVKDTMFVKADQDQDGRVSFEEAKALIIKSLKCAADLVHAPQPTQEDVREAFDAHDTLAVGRGRMGLDEFVNLTRYLQVRVADSMLPLSKVITG